MGTVGAGATGAAYPESHGVGATREFARKHNLAYPIFVALAVVGGIMLAWSLLTSALTSAASLAYAGLWALWGMLAYAVVTRADLNWSVPGKVRLAALAWGVLCLMYSGQLVGLFERAIPTSDEWSAAVHAPLPEEAVKLLGVVLIAFVVPAVFGRPLGALTVGMLTGLGFTIIENLAQTNGAVAVGQDVSVGQLLLERGVYGAPWAHSVFTGIAALGVWCVVALGNRSRASRITAAVAFFVLAVFLHFLQDSLGPVFDAGSVVIGFWVLQLVVLLGLVWWARRVDRRWFRTVTAGGLPPVLDFGEAASLENRRTRRRARRAGATREIQKTQLRYVNAVSDGDDSTAEDLLHRERLLRIGGQQGTR